MVNDAIQLDDSIRDIQDRHSIFKAMRSIAGAEHVLTKKEDLRPFECDGLSVYRQLPLVVVLPESIEQIQDILKYCKKHELPVIARGAGTGLSGGALPREDAVLLSLARFNRILSVKPQERIAVVQPGVRNLAISDAAKAHGLYYAPDPSSQIACSIGGNVAENAGGVHCLKYGLTVNNILSVTIVTIDGEILTLGANSLDSPGYDLMALITGSEGMLGVIVEITVKLLPVPEYTQLLLAAFDDVVKAGQAVHDIISNGIIPAGLELMDTLSIRASEDFAHAGYPVDAAAILLCEIDGRQTDIEYLTEKLTSILESSGAYECRLSKNDEERQLLWSGRKAAFPAVGRISPDYYCMDGTIPRKQLAFVLEQIAQMSEKYSLRVANVFHAGDGNLHPLILFDANQEGELHRAEQFGAQILELCVEVGGTITGEHGVGMEKLNEMCIQFSDAERQQFHAIKEAFDPQRLLNPGKAVPTLHRCAEFGAMHVHKGNLPHPELDRF